MEDRHSKNNRKTRRILRLRWLWIIGGLGVLLALILISIPLGISYGIERYFIANGADQVNVEDVDFNPFTRRIVIKNLIVHVHKEKVLNISEARFSFAWFPFFNKRFILKKVELDNSTLVMEELPDGRWRMGGFLPASSKDKPSALTWGFGISELQVRIGLLKLRSPQLTSELKIDQARLTRLRSWLPNQNARLEIQGQLNDGQLQFQGNFSPFGQNTTVEGTMKLQGLTLTPFAQLIASSPDSLRGRLDADVRFQGKYNSDKGFDFEPSGHLSLKKSHLGFADVEIVDEDLMWGGELQVKLSNTFDEIDINANGQLEGKAGSVSSTTDPLSFKHSGLVWKGKFALDRKQHATDLSIDGGLKLNAFEMAASSANLAEESLNWNGNVQIKLPDSIDPILISATGQMDANGSFLGLTTNNLTLHNARLNWNGTLNIKQSAETSDYEYEGVLNTGDFKLGASDVVLSNKSIKWNGRFELLMDENGEKNQLMTRGKLESEGQVITFSREKMNFEHGRLQWDGQLDSGLTNFPVGLAAEGSLNISDLAVDDRQKKLKLLASKTINLKSIKADANRHVSIAEAKITGLDLIGQTEPAENAPLFSASEVQIDSIIFEQLKKLSIQSARIVAAQGVLHHKSDGRWLYISDLESFLADSDRSQKKPSSGGGSTGKIQSGKRETGVQPGIQIGSLEIVGDSALYFADDTVNPNFHTELRLKKAVLTDVDSYQPEKASPFLVEALSRKYTNIKLQGTVQPFGERISMELKGKIRAVEMPPLSPYAVETLGYNLINGEMDADINLKITAGKMAGEADLKLHDLVVEAVDPKKMKSETGRPIPLESALKVLRDNDNDVHLKIPVSGDVSHPQFSASDAINQALIKGLTFGTLSYLKYALGPYGLAISIAQLGVKYGAKALTGIRLKPVEFRPGSSEPDAAAQEYVEKVANIMKEKKDVRIRLCGWATEIDRAESSEAAQIPPTASGGAPSQKETASDRNSGSPAKARSPLSDEEMLALAQQRADKIEDILVSQYGIKSERVFICKPEIDKKPESTPRVEIIF